MTTIPKATERVIEATKAATDTIVNTALQAQDRRWHLAEQSLNDAVETWQKEQQVWLNLGAEALTRWQNYNRSLMRSLLKESEATQQETRRINEALVASGRVFAETAQELALAWTRLVLSAASLPVGTYASYANRLEELSKQPAEANA